TEQGAPEGVSSGMAASTGFVLPSCWAWSRSRMPPVIDTRCVGAAGGLRCLMKEGLRTLSARRDQGCWCPLAITAQRIVPENVPGQGIQAVDVSVRGHDQAIAIE